MGTSALWIRTERGRLLLQSQAICFSALRVHKEDPGIQKRTVPMRRLDDLESGELGLFQGTRTGLDSFERSMVYPFAGSIFAVASRKA